MEDILTFTFYIELYRLLVDMFDLSLLHQLAHQIQIQDHILLERNAAEATARAVQPSTCMQ